MSNPQKIKFRSVDEFLDNLSDNELVIVEYLRELILDCIPECTEKLAYNVPFYYKNSRICYIWPASVPWGGVNSGVAIGFCQGNLMATVKLTNTKFVSKQVFSTVEAIDTQKLKSQIYEAVLIDDEMAKTKKKK